MGNLKRHKMAWIPPISSWIAQLTLGVAVTMSVLPTGASKLQAQTTGSLAKQFDGLSPERKLLFEETANNLRCPTCSGLGIMQSDAPFSLQIRQTVLDQIDQGKSQDEIIDFFTKRYGLWILRKPPTSGFHLFAWLVPGLFLLLGPLVIYLFVWRNRRQVSTFGIRKTEVLLSEFDEALASARLKRKTQNQ